MYGEDHILEGYIHKDVDPYFTNGYRSHLRYVAKDYAYACLMEFAPDKIEPLDYIHYAKSDLLSKDLRGAINALNNANRAIHLLVDCFLEVIGLFDLYRKDNFPSKLQIIEKLEAFPVSLIGNLNSKRNIVEHEYKTISHKEALEFVEIAEIFVRLCYSYLRKTMTGTRIGEVGNSSDIEWMLHHADRKIVIQKCMGANCIETRIGSVYFNFDGKERKEILSEIPISKQNMDEWVPILNTFLYCSQKQILHEPPPYNPKNHARVMVFQTTHLYAETETTGEIPINDIDNKFKLII